MVLSFLIPVQHILVQLHQRHEFTIPFHNQGFIHAFNIIDDLFDFLRIDIFPGWTEYHIVQTSLDAVPSLLVNAGKVIGLEPSVFGEN